MRTVETISNNKDINGNTSIDVVLVSGSMLFLEGMRRILDSGENLNVVGQTQNHKDINKLVKKHKPDCLFIDKSSFEDDIEKVLCAKTLKANTGRIVLFGDENEDQADTSEFIRVSDKTDTSEIINIISNGQNHETQAQNNHGNKAYGLTKTEYKIIHLIALGLSNNEVAENLSISEKTVKAHITNIFIKLNLKNRYQLIVYGKRNKRRL